MPSIYDIKPKFQDLLRPLVKNLAKAGITANQVTFSAILVSFIGGGTIVFFRQNEKILFIIPLVLLVRMALNAIDGMLAREFNMKTSLGAILNELGDVFSDITLYLPFALINSLNGMCVLVIVLLSVISEMAGVVSVQIGAQRKYNGPMGKSDRAFVFGLISLFIGFGLFTPRIYTIMLLLIIALLGLTIFNRISSALKEVNKHAV
ncbi:MAG: CDP-alcohol phosphatidyltransferase family protein [Candidatus Omnitrophica bacterium]|nr:CDP-alcohol phosphatidyltransferase family protein [Candidatus Omnitrophota bacterium]